MSEALSALFDGEEHLLELDEHFMASGCSMVIVGWEEDEPEEELTAYESMPLVPQLEDRSPVWRTRGYLEKFPLSAAEQAWGALSVALTAFASICEFEKMQYEHLVEGSLTDTTWSFQTKDHITERM